MTGILPADWTVNIIIIGGIWSVLVALQVVSLRSNTLPSLGDIVRLLRRFWLLRWILIVLWAWLGWHLFVRTAYW